MKLLTSVIFLILVNGLFADNSKSINSPECGIRGRSSEADPCDKIFGGQTACKADFPWQVRLNIGCGGSLINELWVLTAAHCTLYHNNLSNFTITLGMHDRSSEEEHRITRTVVKIIDHPEYDQPTTTNDISLLKLDKPVKFNKYMRPICIPDGSYDFVNKQCIATGWGATSSTVVSARFLQQVEIPIVTDQKCREFYGSEYNSTVAICASEFGDGKGICAGDSGGPLACQQIGNDNVDNVPSGRYFKTGISSWSRGCGHIAVYTRTAYYYNWIKNHVENS